MQNLKFLKTPAAWSLIFLGLCAIIIATQYPPFFRSPILNRDAGAFQYVGWQFLEGKSLYADVWDHKPPGVFYVIASSQAIFGSTRAILGVEYLITVMFIVIIYFLLKRHFSLWITTSSTLLTMMLMIRLNLAGELYTSTFALLPLVIALFYADKVVKMNRFDWRYFIIGAMGGLVLLFKYNLGATFFSIGLILCWRIVSGNPRQRRSNILALGLMGLGTIVVLMLGILPLVFQDALSEAYEASLHYNVLYANSEISWERLNDRLYNLEESHRKTTLLWTMLIGGMLVTYKIITRDNRLPRFPMANFIVWLATPIETALLLVPAQAFVHYYAVLLPAGALMTAYLLQSIEYLLALVDLSVKQRRRILGFFVILLISGSIRPTFAAVTGFNREFGKDDRRREVLNMLKTTVAPDETFLIWGAESGFYVASERSAASRFFYQYALLRNGYDNPALTTQFIADLEQSPPKIIIDTHTSNFRMPPLDRTARALWIPPEDYGLKPELEPFFEFVAQHYIIMDFDMPFGWVVYEYQSTIE